MSRKLKLLVDKEDLRTLLAAQLRITLAKTINQNAPLLTWVTFYSRELATAEWSEDYWIYASTTKIERGAMITKLTEVNPGPAQTGGYYQLTPAATFSEYHQSTSTPATDYMAYNSMPYSQYQMLTFGLSQSITVNDFLADRLPFWAENVPATYQVNFTPNSGIYIWLQNNFDSGMVFSTQQQMSSSAGLRTLVRFLPGVDVITLKYDPNMGVFMPLYDDRAMLEDGRVEVHTPLIV